MNNVHKLPVAENISLHVEGECKSPFVAYNDCAMLLVSGFETDANGYPAIVWRESGDSTRHVLTNAEVIHRANDPTNQAYQWHYEPIRLRARSGKDSAA